MEVVSWEDKRRNPFMRDTQYDRRVWLLEASEIPKVGMLTILIAKFNSG